MKARYSYETVRYILLRLCIDVYKRQAFNLACAIIHAIGEVLACLLFYTTTTMPNIDLIYVVFVLVGGGTIVHSLVDGYIALYIYKAIPGLSKSGNK